MSRAKRAVPTRGPGIPGWVKVIGGLSWSAVLWIGTGVALVVGLPFVEAQTEKFAQEPTRIEWVNTPAWLSNAGWPAVLADVEKTIALDPQAIIYDKNLCNYVAQRALTSPWVRQIRKVWTLVDGRVCVQADFREPKAVVQVGQEYYLVDDGAVRLPAPSAAIRPEEWIVLRGVKGKVPAPGQKWDGDDLTAGLKMLDFLNKAASMDRLPFRAELTAIDVSNRHRRLDPYDAELKLITKVGPVIRWGLPPGEENPIEQAAVKKLNLLIEAFGPGGRFPDLPWLDVRSDGMWGPTNTDRAVGERS